MNKALLALQDYAKDFYADTDFGDSNVVGSPLGSWLLVASVASTLDFGNDPSLKVETEKCLHMSIEEAREAATAILGQYRELNYVSQAWTIPDLNSLPAVKKWVEANALIPVEGNIPSQEQINKWAATNTNDLIKEFPAQMNDDTLVVIANIIYSKLNWKTKFVAVPATDAMKSWEVETVLSANATNDVLFAKDENNDVFAVYSVKATGDKETVSLVTCLSREADPKQLMGVLANLESLDKVSPNDELLLTFSSEMYKVKEVRRGSTPTVIEATVPAWDAESSHGLLEKKSMGYHELFRAFSEGSVGGFAADAKQVAVAKFDKEGFEAAALTAMVMARSAMPSMVTQTIYELNFTKPFVFVSYIQDLPIFSGYICKAKEGK